MTAVITIEDKLKWARARLNRAEVDCKIWVEQGRISEGRAELELAIIRSVVVDYQRAFDRPMKEAKDVDSSDGRAVPDSARNADYHVVDRVSGPGPVQPAKPAKPAPKRRR